MLVEIYLHVHMSLCLYEKADTFGQRCLSGNASPYVLLHSLRIA